MARKSRVIIIPIDEDGNVRTDYTKIVTKGPTVKTRIQEVFGFMFLISLCSIFMAILASGR